MVVKIAGLWEQGWNTPFVEHDEWYYMLKEFEVDEWFMSPISGVKKSDKLQEVDDIQEVIDANPDLTVVWVDENGGTPLKDFVHPENALYISGKTSNSLLFMKKEEDESVFVETHVNGGGFWAHQVTSIILYDRFIKNGGNSN